METRIRPATADDWTAYREIRLRMLAQAPRAYGSRHAEEVRFDETRWRERAANPLLLLAYADDRLVGTATGLIQPDGEVAVVAMFVEPEARGQGVADRLLDRLAAAGRERGARRLTLHVTGGNRAATRCYTRYGFTRTGRRWPMERNPELVEIEMALELRPGAAAPASPRDGAGSP